MVSDWSAFLQELGEPAYRSTQILQWFFEKRVRHWEEMKNLPSPPATFTGRKVPNSPLGKYPRDGLSRYHPQVSLSSNGWTTR